MGEKIDQHKFEKLSGKCPAFLSLSFFLFCLGGSHEENRLFQGKITDSCCLGPDDQVGQLYELMQAIRKRREQGGDDGESSS